MSSDVAELQRALERIARLATYAAERSQGASDRKRSLQHIKSIIEATLEARTPGVAQ